jgi:hypothetical protein
MDKDKMMDKKQQLESQGILAPHDLLTLIGSERRGRPRPLTSMRGNSMGIEVGMEWESGNWTGVP